MDLESPLMHNPETVRNQGEANEQEEIDDEYAKTNYYYLRFANYRTDKEQEDIFGSTSIQLRNLVYVAAPWKTHISGKNNSMITLRKFVAKHVTEWSRDILLSRPSRKAKCNLVHVSKKVDGRFILLGYVRVVDQLL